MVLGRDEVGDAYLRFCRWWWYFILSSGAKRVASGFLCMKGVAAVAAEKSTAGALNSTGAFAYEYPIGIRFGMLRASAEAG